MVSYNQVLKEGMNVAERAPVDLLSAVSVETLAMTKLNKLIMATEVDLLAEGVVTAGELRVLEEDLGLAQVSDIAPSEISDVAATAPQALTQGLPEDIELDQLVKIADQLEAVLGEVIEEIQEDIGVEHMDGVKDKDL